MKKAIFLLLPTLICGLYYSQVFLFHAVEIDLVDLDTQVINLIQGTHDELVNLTQDPNTFIQEGDLVLESTYDNSLQSLVDQEVGVSYSVFFGDQKIQSIIDPDDFEVCMYEMSFWKSKKRKNEYLKETVHFRFYGGLETSTKWPMISESPKFQGKRFMVNGKLVLTGIYKDEFVDFYLKKLILQQLKNTTDELL